MPEPGNSRQKSVRQDCTQRNQSIHLAELYWGKETAATTDWAARPWDKEAYEGVSDFGIKLYRGVILSKKRYPGKEGRRRTRQIEAPATALRASTHRQIDLTQDVEEHVTAPGQSSTHRLINDSLAAVDASSSSVAPPPSLGRISVNFAGFELCAVPFSDTAMQTGYTAT